MVIYADVLFFTNFISDYLALWLLGKAMKLRRRTWRITAGSALGAACSVFIFCSGSDAVFLKIVPAVLMLFIAYGFNGRRTLRQLAAFFLIIAAVSGISVMAVSLLPMGVDSAVKNGIAYFDISGKLLFLILTVSYPMVHMLFRFMKQHRAKVMYKVQLCRGGRTVNADALFDSGNVLKEPVSGRPVVIAEWDGVKGLFENPPEYEKLAEKIAEYKMRIIPYRAIGNSEGRILAFPADRISVDGKITEKIFIGVTGDMISEEYHMLLNAELI